MKITQVRERVLDEQTRELTRHLRGALLAGLPGHESTEQALGREIAEREQLERALVQQTAYTKLLQLVAVAANHADTIEAAFRPALEQICATTGWAGGHVYLAVD